MLRITRQTDYGIVLLTRFAALAPGSVRNARDLAQDEGLPAPMVSKILKLLARTGLLVSHRGAAGGYHLARPPTAISVAEIVTALEGPIAMTECLANAAEAGAFPCSIEASCPSRPNWQRINQAIGAALDGVHLSDMLPRSSLSTHVGPVASESLPLAGHPPRS
jgi:FeS assembly SUF system regulator